MTRPSHGFAQRLRRAFRHLEDVRGEDLTQPQFADLVAAELGRERAHSQNAVSTWFKTGVRDVDVIWGIARACGVRESWLAFTDGPMLAGDPLADIRLPPEAMRPAAELDAEEQRRATKRGRAG